jgi:hypothetical protein
MFALCSWLGESTQPVTLKNEAGYSSIIHALYQVEVSFQLVCWEFLSWIRDEICPNIFFCITWGDHILDFLLF